SDKKEKGMRREKLGQAELIGHVSIDRLMQGRWTLSVLSSDTGNYAATFNYVPDAYAKTIIRKLNVMNYDWTEGGMISTKLYVPPGHKGTAFDVIARISKETSGLDMPLGVIVDLQLQEDVFNNRLKRMIISVPPAFSLEGLSTASRNLKANKVIVNFTESGDKWSASVHGEYGNEKRQLTSGIEKRERGGLGVNLSFFPTQKVQLKFSGNVEGVTGRSSLVNFRVSEVGLPKAFDEIYLEMKPFSNKYRYQTGMISRQGRGNIYYFWEKDISQQFYNPIYNRHYQGFGIALKGPLLGEFTTELSWSEKLDDKRDVSGKLSFIRRF
ncbi:MAG: hypothetical protein NT157_06570, partial [Candidatus Micrarchaeota archaeon]|nr:hypothetical protein [Candidatus Micrarchaeota archaeon]